MTWGQEQFITCVWVSHAWPHVHHLYNDGNYIYFIRPEVL